MLNSRMRIILQELLGASSPLTSEYLAKVASVTSRTIRHDMRMLEEAVAGHGARIESMRGTGYLLKIIDKEKFKKFLTDVAEIDSRHGRIIPLYPGRPRPLHDPPPALDEPLFEIGRFGG